MTNGIPTLGSIIEAHALIFKKFLSIFQWSVIVGFETKKWNSDLPSDHQSFSVKINDFSLWYVPSPNIIPKYNNNVMSPFKDILYFICVWYLLVYASWRNIRLHPCKYYSWSCTTICQIPWETPEKGTEYTTTFLIVSFLFFRYPAGVNPASCPNYPYCGTGLSASEAVPPLPGFSARFYRSAVQKKSNCPNYPYCDYQ